MLSAQRAVENPCRPRHFRPLPPCAPVIADEREAAQIETTRSRLVMTAALFAVVFLVLVLRLADIALLTEPPGETHSARAHTPATLPPPPRADIIDRNGHLLATTLDSPSLYADPRLVQNSAEATRAILTVFPHLDAIELRNKLSSGKSFVWIKRRLTPKQQFEANRLGIPGLNFQHEVRRVYPYGDLASHVVGFCGIDNNGLAGIERALDSTVKSSHEPLQLSLDARVQFILHQELAKVVADFTAKGAAGVIMNVHTGEIIAMVSLPDFDPNHPGHVDPRLTPAQARMRTFNKITLGDYELGSVFKTFNTAMALDAGTATMTKQYDAVHNIRIGRFTISDYHGKHRWLSVPEIYMYSSNLGSARMALEAGAERQRSFLARLGLLKPVPIQFDELATPQYPKQWREVNVITIAYGHGIAVTPLHAVTAVSAIVNGGILRAPTFRKLPPDANPPGKRVISPKTSEQMRKLMRLVVEYGTARKAEAPGYVVGGKTGTAEKNVGGHYVEKKLLSDFVGAFPMNDPKYAFILLVDEPHPNKTSHGYATAGWTVVPAAGRLVQRIAPILGVPPVDENSPEIKRAMAIESLQGKKIESY
jgi:cell division protein FtsI (penicillin-binding protein 3)